MKIVRVSATPIHVPIKVALVGAERQSSMSPCLVEVETDEGVIGHGFTAITEEVIVASAVNAVAGPAIIGEDPLAHERIWDKLYWEMMPRGQTGYAAHALAAIDVALWDIKGKVFDQPVWRLLGGARRERIAGRDPLSGGRTLSQGVRRLPGRGRRLHHPTGDAGYRLHAEK